MDLLIAHDVGLPKVVRADDNPVALKLLAAVDEFLGGCGHFGDSVQASVFTGALLSTLTFASFRKVRIVL